MVRVGISVEGVTEEKFVKTVLAPYLLEMGIYITPINMGGAVKLNKIRSELKNIASSFDFVTTFYDFYGFHSKDLDDGETKASLEAKITHHSHPSIQPKLIPYVQMYEFEGLLFSGPDEMQNQLAEDGVSDWANGILTMFKNSPENINNSPHTAPSKRLEANTCYRKTTHGPNIAKEIGIDKIRKQCSGFNNWLCRLEELGE